MEQQPRQARNCHQIVIDFALIVHKRKQALSRLPAELIRFDTIAMPFSEAVKVMLYARSGNRCAYPGCPLTLVFTEKHAGVVVNFGRAAHIVAESVNGPRGRSKMSAAERNSYQNGIIFCGNHHDDVVDKMPEKFPARLVRQWKDAHEKKYGNLNALGAGRSSKYLPLYAEYVDHWAAQARLNSWFAWTAPLLRAGAYFMPYALHTDYIELVSWLANRVWPGKLRSLESAFNNFGRVASDLIFTFNRHAEASGSGELLRTDKFYSRSLAKSSSSAMAEYQYHVALIEDLVLELTRAANLICDRVRESVDAQFRVEEGRLMVESGMYLDSEFKRHVPQYTVRERSSVQPYPGLEKFMKIRERRDLHFGYGVRNDYLRED